MCQSRVLALEGVEVHSLALAFASPILRCRLSG
jgi:hypothetical protein